MSPDALKYVPEEASSFVRETGSEKIRQVEEKSETLEQQAAERQKLVGEQIAELKRKIEQRTISLNEAIETQYELEFKLAEKEMATLGKILNIIQIRELKNKIQITKEKISDVQKEFSEASGALDQAQLAAQDHHELDAIDSLLSNFATTETDRWREHKEQLKVRDVAEISRANNVLFLHTFLDEDTQRKVVTVLDQTHTSLDTHVNIVMGLNPDLSTSTVRVGSGKDSVWGTMGGFIVTNGSVSEAFAGDGGTHSNGMKKESISYAGRDKKNAAETQIEIRSAIHDKQNRAYNELVVARPGFGGFVINNGFRKYESGITEAHATDEVQDSKRQIIEDLNSIGMPLYYQLGENRFQKVEYDPETKKFTFKEEVGVSDVLDNGYVVTEEQKAAFRDKIFSDCPYNLNHPEKQGADNWKIGVTAYDELATPKTLGQDESGLIKTVLGMTFGNTIPCTDRKSCIEALRDVVEKKKIRDEVLNTLKREVVYAQQSLDDLRSSTHDQWGGKISPDKIAEAEARLVDRKFQVQKRLEKLQQQEGFGKDLSISWYMYGFAEAAKRAGDDEIYQKAMELARSTDPITNGDETKQQEIIKKRLGGNANGESKFMITEADLDYVQSQ